MHKVIGFELKKLVSRPGIYILSVLLAILLTVSLFIYEPEKNITVYNTLDGTSINEISENFKLDYKDSYDNNLSSALALATQINTHSASSDKAEINALIDEIEEDVELFYDTSVNALATESQKIDALKEIRNSSTSLGSFDRLYSFIITKLGTSETKIHYAVTTRKSYNKIVDSLTEMQNNFDSTLETKEYTAMAKMAYTQFVPEIKNLVSLIKFPNYLSITSNFIDNGSYYLLTKERLEIVLREMEIIDSKVAENVNLNGEEDLIIEYNNLFNNYRLIIKNYTTLLATSINVCLLEEFSPSDQTNLQFINNIDYYTEKETQARYTYYIEEDKTELDYASPLSFDVTSNGEISAYDYSYFALSIFSVALIVFAVMLASHSIAGENKEGTLRFVAIRPISRTKLIFGKFLSVALISLILLIFGTISAVVVGGFMYGFDSNLILTIINTSDILILHPIASLSIYVLSIYLKLLVFVSLAMLLSACLKSDLLSLIIVMLVYLVNLVLPLLFDATSWLRFNPFTNLNIYAFFGVNSTASDSMLAKLFNGVVYNGINFYTSLIFIFGMILIFNIISAIAFKRKEL